MKAASYLRVSGAGQIEGDGFERQRVACARWATAGGHELVAEYREEGVSGTTDLEDRAALAELLDRAESNGIKVVVVERADRLARDLMVGEVILAQFRAAKVQVVTADGVDLTENDNPTAVLLRQLLGAVAEFEKRVLVAKLAAARKRRRDAGHRCEGAKPYPPEVIQRIREERTPRFRGGKPWSYRLIAAHMTEDGVPTRNGRPWSFGTIAGICKREGID